MFFFPVKSNRDVNIARTILEKSVLPFWETACQSLLQVCQDLLEDLVEATVDLLDPQVLEVLSGTLESRVKLDKEDSQDFQVSIFWTDATGLKFNVK